MTFLPIVERELRVRARSKGWHWIRFGVVAAGALVCVPGLLWGTAGGPAEVGKGVFTGLIAAAFLLCCGACLLTADVISSERREGTLILLFLTRIKSFDVLLGKLASAGLAGFCALVACAPLLIIPVLAGGVTVGEAVRKSLVLMDTMFVALAAGIWSSAKGRSWIKRAGGAVLILGAILLVPAILEADPVAWAIVGVCLLIFASVWVASRNSSSFRNSAAGALLVAFLVALPVCGAYLYLPVRFTVLDLGLTSPLVGLICAADVEYKASHSRFWVSLGLVQAIGWGLLLTAGMRLKRALREEDLKEMTNDEPEPRAGIQITTEVRSEKSEGNETRTTSDEREMASGWKSEAPSARGAIGRGKGLSWPQGGYRDPIEWLLEGQRGTKALVWTGAAIGFFQYGIVPAFWRLMGPGSGWMILWPLGLVLTAIQGTLFAWAACRFFIEARRTGEIELLMTTPLGATSILSAQWKRLTRILLWPAAVIVTPIPLIGLVTAMNYRGYPPGLVASWMLNAVDVFFGLGATCWLGLWFGWKARSLGMAIVWTVALAKGVPFLISVLSQLIMRALIYPYAIAAGGVGWLLLLTPQMVILWYYVKLIRWARSRFTSEYAPVPRGFRLNRPCETAMTDVK